VAGEDLLTYSGQASIAYQDALNQARNTQNALLRQYGFTAPSASGEYSVEGAQAAFDPNTLFDKATGGVDKAKLESLVSGLQVGGRGLLADITRAGASGEAEAMSEVRSRGFGGEIGGGLLGQRRALAEAQAAGQLGTAKQQFLGGLGEALSPIGGAYQNLQTAMAQDKAAELEAIAARSIIPSVADLSFATEAPQEPAASSGYSKKGTPGGKPPASPRGGALFTGPGGVKWQYRMNGPSGKGWYRK
jgi:hypothetical protein